VLSKVGGVCVCSDATGQYILRVGQVREVRLFIRVSNRGEDAHEAAVNIILPPLVEYLGTDSDVSPLPLLCLLPRVQVDGLGS